MKCCICGKECENEWGNNPWPLYSDDNKCCNECNDTYVLYARLNGITSKDKEAIDKILEMVKRK